MHVSVTLTSVFVGAVWVALHSIESDAAQSPPGVPAIGHFVDCDAGNDAAAGTSHTTAWRTLATINNSRLAVGSDVWLKAGTTCDKQRVVVTWNGTSTDPAIVGSYYVSGGVAYQGYVGSTRPILRGTYDSTCSRSLNPALPSNYRCAMNANAGVPAASFPAGSAYPSNMYTPMLQANCNFCEIRDLEARFSAGVGMADAQSKNNVTFRNNVIHVTANQGFTIANYWSTNIIVTGNFFDYNNVGGDHGDFVPPAFNAGSAGSIGNFSDPQNLLTYFNPTGNILFENNTIETVYGEGLITSNTANVIIRGNRWGNVSSALLYAQDCINCVWEYNIIWGGKPRTTFRPDDPNAYATYGIGPVSEDRFAAHPPGTTVFSGIIRGNMVVHASNCISVGMEPESAAQGYKVDLKIYNNTCINSSNGLDFSSLGAANVTRLEVRNNIFYNEAGVTPAAFGCNSPTIPAITFDYNLWNSTPTDPDCRGAHDITGNPMLSGSNFNAMLTQTATQPGLADFELQPSSPALGAGTPLTGPLARVPSTIRSQVSYLCATFDLKGSIIDAVCAVRNEVPNLGALEGAGNGGLDFSLSVE